MQIPISLAFYLLATSASAFPIGFGLEIRKLSNPNCSAASATAAATAATASPTVASQAKSAAVGSSASVLSPSTYNAIQISTGTAGNSKANADALFSAIDQSNLAGVSAEDLKVIQDTHDAAENAETEAFNPAIAAASGAAATALQNGKIANKVLKLTAEVLGLQIKQAQGTDESSDITAETTKLNNNIALDTKAAGQAMTPVSFDATIG
ncbi:hypothetical protein OIDMADRAFT_183869 [Oidiodendron maius Zn]|uniref:Small secreted protein n=1 Tax=Oidiodendron maius (strain Zn) TaxID=913774 RepID=A0A0C3C8Q0_OIDMZ|nr:hypothetical protein OIDMADRAFT_183869 [Oidiodendron maius Zn]